MYQFFILSIYPMVSPKNKMMMMMMMLQDMLSASADAKAFEDMYPPRISYIHKPPFIPPLMPS